MSNNRLYPGAIQEVPYGTSMAASTVACSGVDIYKGFLNVMARYDMPEEAKECLSKMQEYIDAVEDGKEPNKEQWLAIRENMLKYWAIMMTHVLTQDMEMQAHKDRMNALLDLQAKQQQWQTAYQIYNKSGSF